MSVGYFFSSRSLIVGNFPGGPVVKTSPSNVGGAGWGCGFDPWSGNYHPTCLMAKKLKQKQYCNKFSKDVKKWSTSKKKKRSLIVKEKAGVGFKLSDFFQFDKCFIYYKNGP